MRATRTMSLTLVAIFLTAAAATAEENPFSAHNKFVYKAQQKILLRATDMVPEEAYAFKPTEAVRSFGQIVGHVADAQYLFCSIALGEKNPAPQAEIVAAGP